MPPLVDQPNVLKVRYQWSMSADTDVGTTTYFSYTGTAPSDATCATIAGAIYTAAVTNLIPLIQPDLTLAGVSVTDLTTPSSGFGEHLASTPGTRTGTVLPAGTAALNSCKILRRYRGGKPRQYWPFGTASDMSDSQSWATAAVTAFNTGLAAQTAAVLASGSSGCTIAAHVNVSYYSGFTSVQNPVTLRWRNVPKPRTVAIAPDAIITQAVGPNVASQRRRNQTL